MNVKKHIPNLITLGNLFCGTLATIFAVEGDLELAGLYIVLGIGFDFFDGFAARLLKVQGELGKQLDSLADMVTSGVAPGIIMMQLLETSQAHSFSNSVVDNIPYLGLLLTLAACYRLANFNIDTRQSDSFIGIPTPAMALFVISLPLIGLHSNVSFFTELIHNNYFLIAVTVLLSYLMNAELPLFALKFKSFGFKENVMKYLFLLTSVVLLVLLQFVAIPLIIILYVVISVVANLKKA
ncbi:MAG: CDP-alcohol phosphatidyltransferase family protein [Flavobacteriaceae bacterium]